MSGISEPRVTWPGRAWRTPVPAMRVHQASLRIGRTDLLREVSFDIHPGTVTALVGPNGAGKSTMLSLLAGDRPASSGGITLGGRDIADWSRRDLAQARSVMVQQHMMQFAYSVREIVALGRAPQPADPDRDEAIVNAALRLADLDALSGRDVSTLSGGELARVVFARTLTQDTPIVLLDEPTAALDLHHTEQLMGVLRAWGDAGCSVLVVVHDLNLAARYADRVLIFDEGVLATDDDPHAALTASRIRAVYGQSVTVLAHPESGAPLIVPTTSAPA